MYPSYPSDSGTDSSAGIGAAIGTILVIYFLIILAVVIFNLVCNWIIFSKAGYSGARSLLLLIPIVGFIIYLMFVFSKWPVQQELEQRRMQGGFPPNVPVGAPPYPPQQY